MWLIIVFLILLPVPSRDNVTLPYISCLYVVPVPACIQLELTWSFLICDRLWHVNLYWWMEKDYISNDTLILILQEIHQEIRPLYSEELFENILLIMLYMIMTDLLRPLDYILDDTDITCTTMHISLDIVTIYIVPWSWYTLYSLFDIDIIDIDLWSYLIESPIVLYLHWLIKLTKPGLLGQTDSRGIREACLEGRPLVGLDAIRDIVFLWFMRAPIITVTWYLGTVKCFSLLSESTNATLIWYTVVLWDGAQDGCISIRLIKC